MVSGRERAREIVEQAVTNRADHHGVWLTTGWETPWLLQGTIRGGLRVQKIGPWMFLKDLFFFKLLEKEYTFKSP